MAEQRIRGLAAIILAGVVAAAGPVDANPGDEEIVAKVNGVVITKGEVRTQVTLYERAHPGLPGGASRLNRAKSAASVLVENVLKEEVARDLGIVITDADVDAAIKERQGKTSDAMYGTMLQLAGSSPAKLRYDMRTGLTQIKTVQRLEDSVVVTEKDLRAKYEQQKILLFPVQVKARQIIVLTQDLADRVYQQLMDGEDFAALAQAISTDLDTRRQGGDMGWVLIGHHYPPWDDIVFALKTGDVSRPFRTAHGFHIVKVEEYRQAGWGRWQDKRKELETMVRKERGYREFTRRLDEARKRASIWVVPNIDLDAAPATTPKG